MGNFFSALGDIATNESAYRNAIISAVVLLFAASGELIAEKAGTINISLEAMLLAGAFSAAVGADVTHSTGVGLLFAAIAGLIVAAVQANMSHRLPADQFVVGLVLNVLVLGLVGFLTSSIDPQSDVVRRVEVPLLSRIPLLGPSLFDQPWVLYLVYPIVPLVWWLLYRTRWGLEVRAVGEDPIAAVIFGGWTLKGTVAGCVTFGLVGSFVLTIPSLGYKSIDSSFLAMAPSLVTILAMALFAKSVRQPAALARPFIRGLK